jgi:hypothetical protein
MWFSQIIHGIKKVIVLLSPNKKKVWKNSDFYNKILKFIIIKFYIFLTKFVFNSKRKIYFLNWKSLLTFSLLQNPYNFPSDTRFTETYLNEHVLP